MILSKEMDQNSNQNWEVWDYQCFDARMEIEKFWTISPLQVQNVSTETLIERNQTRNYVETFVWLSK